MILVGSPIHLSVICRFRQFDGNSVRRVSARPLGAGCRVANPCNNSRSPARIYCHLESEQPQCSYELVRLKESDKSMRRIRRQIGGKAPWLTHEMKASTDNYLRNLQVAS